MLEPRAAGRWTRMILKVCVMSIWWRLSSKDVRPNSFNFSSYVVPFSPDTIETALCWIFSKTGADDNILLFLVWK
jgi:hypothetical protein